MWTDNETSLDLLGFRVHADLIRSVVTDPKLLPVTVGVFADWGGGKTSLMKMLQESFEPEHWPEGSEQRSQCEQIACLYFSGWLFEGYDDAKSAILSSVLVALGEHKRFGPKVRAKCVSLLKSVNWMRVAHLGLKHAAIPAIAAFATNGASLVPSFIASMSGLIPSMGKAVSDSPDTPPGEDSGSNEAKNDGVDWEGLIRKDRSESGPLDVRTFRDKFAQLLKASNINSLVVLIDDLDRCSPERIVENLEAIKLFLNVEHTAFIIGADPRIVRHAITWKYKDHDDRTEEESSMIVTDYLEKLIQYPYHLPRLSPAEIETYMALLFCQLHLPEGGFADVLTACETQRTANRYVVFGYSAVEAAIKGCGRPTISADLTKALVFSASAAPLITEGLKGNPRQVKRFLNAFVLRRKLANVAKLDNINDDVLVKLMILEYAHEPKFRQLYKWQAAQDGTPKEIAEFERAVLGGKKADDGQQATIAEEWSTPELQRWIKMEPSLTGVDLRDYFWITRDRLQSSMSGVSMIPPLVRRIFDGLISGNASLKTQSSANAKELDGVDRGMLLDLLQRNVKQHPSEKAAYDAFRSMIEANVADAAQRFALTIGEVPFSEMPPAAGVDLDTLAKAKPELGPVFQKVIQKLRESDTKVGKALEKLSQKGKA
jgi:hypothetical protein